MKEPQRASQEKPLRVAIDAAGSVSALLRVPKLATACHVCAHGAAPPFTQPRSACPVSTTHTITGVGFARRRSPVRWGIAGQIVWARILTIPTSAFIAAVTFCLHAAIGLP